MHFDRKGFKRWFSPEENLLNPTMPPKNALDLAIIPFWFLAFGWLVVPMALLDSIKFRS